MIPIPGLEQLPFAEVWFHELDDLRFQAASAQARALGKTGLEVWTTTQTPDVVAWLEARGYEEVRRYVISELDVEAAPDPGPPRFALTTFAERPELAGELLRPRTRRLRRPARARRVADRRRLVRVGATRASCRRLLHRRYATDRAARLRLSRARRRAMEARVHGRRARCARSRCRGRASSERRSRGPRRNGVETLRTANETRLDSMLALNSRLGYRAAVRGDRSARACGVTPSSAVGRRSRCPLP